mmetsp:Transcript_28866/g.26191  ORF Transcript_28866/g.26191 Transcript_28866/m.26191 type:complete len:139 (-) Transcript_28866:343-759(-)
MKHLYPINQGEEVYNRAGHRHNIYEKQAQELREIARNDPNYFYTYSADYLSLSVEPYNPDDIKRHEEQLKKSLFRTPEGFQTILKKDKSEYNKHPKKPHESKIDELNTVPYHEEKTEQQTKLFYDRGAPIKGSNKKDF